VADLGVALREASARLDARVVVDDSGPLSRAAFGARRRPTLIMHAA